MFAVSGVCRRDQFRKVQSGAHFVVSALWAQKRLLFEHRLQLPRRPAAAPIPGAQLWITPGGAARNARVGLTRWRAGLALGATVGKVGAVECDGIWIQDKPAVAVRLNVSRVNKRRREPIAVDAALAFDWAGHPRPPIEGLGNPVPSTHVNPGAGQVVAGNGGSESCVETSNHTGGKSRRWWWRWR